jgi:hypothetical protein
MPVGDHLEGGLCVPLGGVQIRRGSIQIRPHSGLLHWSALADEVVCVALLPVVAQRREMGARGRHNRYRRPAEG